MPPAREGPKELEEEVRRVGDRMRDDHHRLETGQNTLLSAIRAGFREVTARLDGQQSDRFSKFDLYLRVAMILGVAAAVVVGFARGGI